jgi:hypothetical protein
MMPSRRSNGKTIARKKTKTLKDFYFLIFSFLLFKVPGHTHACPRGGSCKTA